MRLTKLEQSSNIITRNKIDNITHISSTQELQKKCVIHYMQHAFYYIKCNISHEGHKIIIDLATGG